MANTKNKTDKAKRKTASKKGKAKRKTASKLATMSVALMVAACGCQQTPSRAQTLTMRDCVINVYGGAATNGVIPAVEVCTQAMSIETGGSETFSPTQTTDTKPDIDVTVGGKASAAKGAGKLADAAADCVDAACNACSACGSGD